MRIRDIQVDDKKPLCLIAGPCVIESRALVLEIAGYLDMVTRKLNVPLIFKASFDKANRTSMRSFRGLGIDKGLEILQEVRNSFQCPILTDVHITEHIEQVSEVVDILQTPAFLCRQSDFIKAVASSGKVVNIKKGQFLSPMEMHFVVEKAKEASGLDNVMVCERGTSFGYNNLVSDMRSLAIMKRTNCPVIFDATHSVQLPGGAGKSSDGQSEFVPVLARAAVAVGVAGIFIETHPDPALAKSDGPNTWPLKHIEPLIKKLKAIDEIVKISPREECLINSEN